MQEKSIKRQIIEPAGFYIAGFLLSWIVFKLTAHPYAHGLDWYSLIALLVFFAGGVWLLKTIVQLLSGQKLYWTLMVHVLVIGGLTLSLIFEMNSSENETELSNQSVTISSNPDDTTSVVQNEKGDTLYFQKDGTTIIDKVTHSTDTANRR